MNEATKQRKLDSQQADEIVRVAVRNCVEDIWQELLLYDTDFAATVEETSSFGLDTHDEPIDAVHLYASYLYHKYRSGSSYEECLEFAREFVVELLEWLCGEKTENELLLEEVRRLCDEGGHYGFSRNLAERNAAARNRSLVD